jgi:hypothetical protein
MTRTFRYCKWSDLDDALRLGWIVSADLGPVHGKWSVLVEYLCDCRPDAWVRG